MKEKLFEYPIFVLSGLSVIAVSFQMIFKNSIVFTSICCILIIFYLYCQTTYRYNKIPQIKKRYSVLFISNWIKSQNWIYISNNFNENMDRFLLSIYY